MGKPKSKAIKMTDREKAYFLSELGIRIDRELGSGVFGIVYQATFVDVMELIKIPNKKLIELHSGPKPEIKESPESNLKSKNGTKLTVPVQVHLEPGADPNAESLQKPKPQAKPAPGSKDVEWISAWRPINGQKVAIKWLEYDQGSRQQVRSEIEALDALWHPNIIDIRAAMWFDPSCRLAIVMELSPIGNVPAWMKLISRNKYPRLTPKEFKAFGVGVCEGVRALHMTKRSHNDLHSGNVLVFDDQRGGILGKVADFGLTNELVFYEIVTLDDEHQVKRRLSDDAIRKRVSDFHKGVEKDKRDVKDWLYTIIDFVVEKNRLGEGFLVYNEVICNLIYDVDDQETTV